MTIKVEMVTVDCRDTYALADWWSRQTGGKVVGERGDEFVMVEPGAGGGPTLGFQQVSEPTPGKNRLHLDVTAPDRDLAVERLLGEGAIAVARHETPGFTWVVLSDPEGNQFCVSQAS